MPVFVLVLILQYAPAIYGQKIRAGDSLVRGTVFLDGAPVRDAEVWLYRVDPTSGKLRAHFNSKTDKYGIYGIYVPPGTCLVSASLAKKVDRDRSRSINRIVTTADRQMLTQDFDFSSRWQGAEQSQNEFNVSLDRLIASLNERPPMHSIMWMPFGDAGIWMPAVILSGADICNASPGMSVQYQGQSVEFPLYVCYAKYDNEESAEAGYRLLVGLLSDKSGWRSSAGNKRTIFNIGGINPSYVVEVWANKENIVNFSIDNLERASGTGSGATSTLRSDVGEANAADPVVPTKPTDYDRSQTPDSQMTMGVLAITSDEQGTLFIDGSEKARMAPTQVVTLKLVAGQHILELRGPTGEKLWGRVVSVLANAQVVEQIEVHPHSSTSPVGKDTRSLVPGDGSHPTMKVESPTLLDSFTSLLHQVAVSGREYPPFTSAMAKQVAADKWLATLVLPGFQTCFVQHWSGKDRRGTMVSTQDYICFFFSDNLVAANAFFENIAAKIRMSGEWTELSQNPRATERQSEYESCKGASCLQLKLTVVDQKSVLFHLMPSL
jgi:hypothetical protein